MKKSLVLMAVAGVALASCVNDVADVTKSQEEQKALICFDNPILYSNVNNSRANHYGEINSETVGSTTYSYPKEESFIIFAVQHDGDFPGWENATKAGFNGDALVRDTNLDGWAPTYKDTEDQTQYYYWPSGKMSFAACSPADMEQEADGWEATNIIYNANGLQIKDFVVPSDPAKHIDVLFAQRTINKTKADMLQNANNYSGIPLIFQHALSSIHFSLSNTSGETVVLKKVTIKGILNQGTFNENIDEDMNDDGTFDYENYIIGTENVQGNVNPGWTPGATTANYDAFTTTDGEGVTFPITPQYITNLLLETGTSNKGTNHVLLVLPQAIPNDATLEVHYTVNGADASKEVQLNTATDKDDSSKYINTWEIGTRYTYRLVYSSESASLDRIYFSPSSDPWKEAGVAIIDLK